MYADYEYYKKEYLIGKEPVIVECDYLYYEKQARAEVDKITFNRYTKLSKEERAGYFTFNIGDIVVKGDCPEEITGKTPNTASELLNRWKQEAFEVTAFSDNTSHMCEKHYRVGG